MTLEQERELMSTVTRVHEDPNGFELSVYITDLWAPTLFKGETISQKISGVVTSVANINHPGITASPVVEVIANDKDKTPSLEYLPAKVAPAIVDVANETVTPQIYIRKSGQGADTKKHAFLFTPEEATTRTIRAGDEVVVSVPMKQWEKVGALPGMHVTVYNIALVSTTKWPGAVPDAGLAYFLNGGDIRIIRKGSQRVEEIVIGAIPLARQRMPPIIDAIKGYVYGAQMKPFLVSCCNVPRTDEATFECKTVLPRGLAVGRDGKMRGIYAEIDGFPTKYSVDLQSGGQKATAMYSRIYMQQLNAKDEKEIVSIPELELFPQDLLGFGITKPPVLDAVMKQHIIPFHMLYKPDLEATRKLKTNEDDCEIRKALYPSGALAGNTYAPFRIVPRVGEYCETHGIPVTRDFVLRRFEAPAEDKVLEKIVQTLGTRKDGTARFVDRPYAKTENPSKIVFLDECGRVPRDEGWTFYALNTENYKIQPRRRPHEDTNTIDRIDMTAEEGDAFVMKEAGFTNREKVSTNALWIRSDGVPRFVFFAVRPLTATEKAIRAARLTLDAPFAKRKAEAAPADEPVSKQARAEAASPAAPEFASEEEHEQGDEKMDE